MPTVKETFDLMTGRFRADMRVHLVNEGPVTLVLDSAPSRNRDSSAAPA